MGGWTAEFVESAQVEFRKLPDDMQASILRVIELLLVAGPAEVGMPHCRPLGHKLYEVRARGRDGIARAIYVAARGRRLIVLRVFVKKTQATPAGEIDLALKRMRALE